MDTNQLSSSLDSHWQELAESIPTGPAKIYMTDMILEFIPEEIESPVPEMISTQVFSSVFNGDYLDLEKISSSSWKCRGAMELSSASVTLVVGWDEMEKGGYLQLQKAELEEFVVTTGSSQIQRELMTTEMGSPVVRLTFEFITIPSDEDAGHQDDGNIHLTMSENQAEYIFSTILPLLEGRFNESALSYDVGMAFFERFHHTNNENDLDRAIQAYARAVQRRPVDDPGSIRYLRAAGIALLERCLLKWDPSDMIDALSHFETVINTSSNDDEPTHIPLDLVAMVLDFRFHDVEGLENLCQEIELRQKAIRLFPEDHPTMHHQLLHLAMSLSNRFKITDSLTDISEAISHQQRLVNLLPLEDSTKPQQLVNLAIFFSIRFGRMGSLDDISASISSRQKAIQLMVDDDEEMPQLLADLGVSFFFRFQCTGDPADISNAISYTQISIHLLPEGHPELPTRLSNLGCSFLCRFEFTGDISYLSEAISCHQEALRLGSPNDEKMASVLFNTGSAFTALYSTTGDLTTISDAISYHQRAVHLTPQGNMDMMKALIGLGHAYQSRFRRTRDLRHISEAISSLQEAINLSPPGHPDLLAALNNLGLSFISRFSVTNNASDASEAISAYQKVFDNSPRTDWHVLGNLGNAYLHRFRGTAHIDDINNAISFCRKSLESITDHNARNYGPLCSLGASLEQRFKLTGHPSDISEAISFCQRGFQLISQGHPAVPVTLIGLGNCFKTRFHHYGNIIDIQEATAKYRLGATWPSGAPSQRFNAAREWAECCRKFDASQLLDAYGTAIRLVSEIAGLDQTIPERHTKLLEISDVASDAAAAACSMERYGLALEWLEQGRCLVWSQLNNLRTPVDELRAHHPALADDILRVSRALENAGSRAENPFNIRSSMQEKISLQEEATAHIKLSKEWEQLLAKVCAIPDFEDFLQPPSCSSLLKHLPDSGAAVVINIHKDRCDALALLSGNDEPLHIPLPDFSYSKADNLRNRLRIHLHACSLRIRETGRAGRLYESGGDAGIKSILRELWTLVVKPILESLGYQLEEPPSKLSRIWWCATGPLAFLPIHAAGIYGSTAETVSTLSDVVISSYTPTIRALIDRVKNPREVDGKKSGLFMISQPDTPYQSPIPGTTAEVRAIEEFMKGYKSNDTLRIHCLESAAATVNKAIMNMERYNCIHFACHASQNISDPLKSGFALYDGLLDLASINRKQLVGADLAFLSACQTSTGDENLSEEAVHLAAGMLAAGYRGVVATMWSISDEYAPGIAQEFYSSLMEGQDGLNSDQAASALHCAVQKLRKMVGDSERDLLVWVPYVHFGL